MLEGIWSIAETLLKKDWDKRCRIFDGNIGLGRKGGSGESAAQVHKMGTKIELKETRSDKICLKAEMRAVRFREKLFNLERGLKGERTGADEERRQGNQKEHKKTGRRKTRSMRGNKKKGVERTVRFILENE